ncbi:hypothetical protein Ahy_A04g019340 [Arachis hypogaea]|uniref:Uncharacterized protein n=1 Tax=Arachis hypogaea TaxID=3818 RepID=A0A445DFY5_ARAHY|nr:hypothetical protein Ahy_A04g019340 [Arachis hypogaea]
MVEKNLTKLLPLWFSVMAQKMPSSIVQIETRPCIMRVKRWIVSRYFIGLTVHTFTKKYKSTLKRVFYEESFSQQHLGYAFLTFLELILSLFYNTTLNTLLVAVAQNGNQNIVSITFTIIEEKISDAWYFSLSNL